MLLISHKCFIEGRKMLIPILNVADVDVSLAFYQKLGFKVDMAMPGPDGVNTFAFASMAGTSIGFNRDRLPQPVTAVEFMVYLDDAEDLDQHYARVKAQGVALASEIKTQYWGDRTYTVHDPDGYIITLTKTVYQADMDYVAAVTRGEVKPD